jgi:threonine dehydratase
LGYHGRRLGIPAVIVMPQYTPYVKVERMRAFGAEILLSGAGGSVAVAWLMVLNLEDVWCVSFTNKEGYREL